MENVKVTTGDRFEAAYYLSHLCVLDRVTFRQENGKEWAYFTFRPENLLTDLAKSYRDGTAVASLPRFKQAFRKLSYYIIEAQRRETDPFCFDGRLGEPEDVLAGIPPHDGTGAATDGGL